MGERIIHPKFNVHENYKRVNIVNPYRYQGGGGVTPGAYEPETTAYMTEVGIPDDEITSLYGIPNSQVWSEVNNFVLALKSIGLSKFIRLFPKLGNSASKAAINLITPSTSGTYYGPWVFNATGAITDGSGTYFNTGFNPFENAFQGSIDIGYTVSPLQILSATASRNILGVYRSSSQRFQLYTQNSGDSVIESYLGGSGTEDNSPGLKIYTASRDSSINYLYGNSTFIDDTTNIGTMPNANVVEGAFDFNGSLVGFFKGTIGVTVYHKHLSETEVGQLHSAINTFETALNRK